MPRHPIELARKHYEGLPAVLKEALFSVDIAEQMAEIGKKFGLTIEQTGIMAEETGYVMLGLSRPNEMVGNLAAELGVDAGKAGDVAAEISHRIFFPLREQLKAAHNFDMSAADIRQPAPEPAGVTRVSGMQMPPSVRPPIAPVPTPAPIQEKSPLVIDLTREKPPLPKPAPPTLAPKPPPVSLPSSLARPAPLQPKPTAPAEPPSRYESFASPTGRIENLQKMIAKPPLPVVPVQPQPPKPKEVPPIHLRPPVPPPTIVSTPVSAAPPLKPSQPTPPQVVPAPPRMTPQMQDVPPAPSLLQEKLRAEPQQKPAPSQSAPAPGQAGTPASSDPYREPIDA